VIFATISAMGLRGSKMRCRNQRTDCTKGISGSASSIMGEQFGAEQHLEVADYWCALMSPDRKSYMPALTVMVFPSPAGYGVVAPIVEQVIAANENKR
jgi:hypothetical protein